MEPRILILETSGRVGSVALATGATIVAPRKLDAARRHARDLAPAVKELLQSLGWRPRDIQALFVSRGPGSYTGLRVGIMAAKAFAFATRCALLAVDTFAAIALQAAQAPTDAVAHTSGSSVDVVADAQQDKIYVQRFVGACAQTDLEIRPTAEWLAQNEPAQFVTGPGIRVLRERLPKGCRPVPEELWDPQPASLLQLGLDRYHRGERDDPFAVEPCYLRPSSAEEKWATLPGGNRR